MPKETLKILILGEGDFYSRRYYPTSFTLFFGDRLLQVECPDLLPKMIAEASRKSGLQLDIDQLDHFVVTHLHGDHSNGLEGLGFNKKFQQGSRKPTIYTIPEVEKAVWNHKLRAAMGSFFDPITLKCCRHYQLGDFFRFRLLYPERVQRILGLRIQIRYTRHYLPCFAFKLFWQGRSFGFSSDTSFDPELIEFLGECDLFFHETNYGGHTPYQKLAALPQEIRRRMVLIHIPEDFDRRRSKMRVARQGEVFEL